MNKLLTAALCGAAALTAFSGAAEEYRSVTVTLTDHTAVRVNLSDDLTTRFTRTEMVITDGKELRIQLDKATVASFEFSETAGLETPCDGRGTAPAVADGVMTFESLPAGTAAHVYGSDGRLLKRVAADASGSLVMDLKSLGGGVYLVRVNGMSYKVNAN